MGIIAPPASAGIPRRILGIIILIVAIVLAILLGWAIVKLVALPFGGIGSGVAFFWGFVLLLIVLGVLIVTGRRRQKRARERVAEQRAQQFGR